AWPHPPRTLDPRGHLGLPGHISLLMPRAIRVQSCVGGDVMPASDDKPIAFFLTWSTYGTWLPGDARGWVEYRRGFRLPDPILELECAARMTEGACRLAPHQRERVEKQVAETCKYKGWILHAVNCRTNHVHVVLSASAPPKIIREQLKAWCTRRLKEQQVEFG